MRQSDGSAAIVSVEIIKNFYKNPNQKKLFSCKKGELYPY